MGRNCESAQNLFNPTRPLSKLCFFHGPWDGAELCASEQAVAAICQAQGVYVSLDALPVGAERETVYTPTTGLVTVTQSPYEAQERYSLQSVGHRILNFVWTP